MGAWYLGCVPMYKFLDAVFNSKAFNDPFPALTLKSEPKNLNVGMPPQCKI